MTTFQGALSGASPTLLQNGVQMIQNILNGITSALPGILNAGVEIILNVANGILQNLPQLITAAFQIITSLVSFLYQNLPTILEAGANLLLGLVNGIIDNLPEIAVAAIEGIALYVSTIGSMLPQILQKGIEIIGQLVVGLIQAIPKIIAAIPQIIAGVTTTLMEFDWAGTGMDIVNGIVEGIKNAGSNILDALWSSVKDAIDWVKEKLGIASPSKYMADNVGKWMAMGVGVGFEDNIPETEMADTVKNTTLSMDTAVNSGVASNTNGISYEAIYEAVKAGAEAAHLEIDIDGRDLTRTLKGLGVAMA
jgi:phage-related protein